MVERALVEWRCCGGASFVRGALPLQAPACSTHNAQDEVVRFCNPAVAAAVAVQEQNAREKGEWELEM